MTTEDLWSLPLESRTNRPCLDDTAKRINKTIKDTDEESFVSQKTTVSTELRDKLEIVKYIISVKLADREKLKKAKETKEKKDKILAIMERKQEADLEGKDLAELQALLDSMEQ